MLKYLGLSQMPPFQSQGRSLLSLKHEILAERT